MESEIQFLASRIASTGHTILSVDMYLEPWSRSCAKPGTMGSHASTSAIYSVHPGMLTRTNSPGLFRNWLISIVFLWTTRRDQLRDCEYIAKHRLKTATGSGSQDSAVAGGVVNTDSVDSLGDTAVGKRDRTLDDQSMGSNSADGVVVEHAHVDDLDDIMELVGETGLTSRRNYLMGMLQCKDWPTWCIRNEDGRVVAFCLMHRDGMESITAALMRKTCRILRHSKFREHSGSACSYCPFVINSSSVLFPRPPLLGRTVGGLAVHPACRRRGYARALVHAVCKSYWANFTTDASRGEPADAHLKRKAHGERYLYAIVSFDNTASISTFTSLGFEQLPDHWYWLGRDQ